ncbi:eukaryotic aspartyl protease family protein [Striga asiatica]|uniref:Eukaryotic aspartyl protease family protein n=1 Tax=Striga asiatica TaxID=4170 RepID=A0A5A7PXY4_STRAF|nr:eukaryotic aspartyl protease family protein [Striga asiatica]
MQHQSRLYLKALVLYLVTCVAAADDPLYFTFPVNGNVYPRGFYNVTITIGPNQRPYILQIDTGSGLTWIQCDKPGARNYPAPNPPYNPEDRNVVVLRTDPVCSVVQNLLPPGFYEGKYCAYDIHYADGMSTQGFLVNDSVNLNLANGQLSPPLTFGCGHNQYLPNPNEPQYVDGVLGLSNVSFSFVSQISRQGLTQNAIGHCFSSKGDGYLSLGLGDLAKYEDFNWTTLFPTTNSDYYYLGKADLMLGGEVTDIRGLDIVFDSGSTYTYLNNLAYDAIYDLIEGYNNRQSSPLDKATDPNLPFCWKGPFTSVSDVSSYFSTLALNFSTNLQFAMGIESYLIISLSRAESNIGLKRGMLDNYGLELESSVDLSLVCGLNDLANVCLGILDGSEVGLGDLNVIGDISFQDKLVIYDNDRQLVGWDERDCSTIPS